MRPLAFLVGLLAALAGLGREARAHAVLLDTEPVADARLAEPPAQLVLRFSEPVVPIAFQLLAGPDNVDLPGPAVSSGEIVLNLPARLGEGPYLLSYRVRSADGHPVAGSLAFTVGEQAFAPIARAETDDAFWAGAGLVLRTLLYGALIFVAGGRLLSVAVPLSPVVAGAIGRPMRLASGAGLVLLVLFTGVAGGGLAGGPPAVLLSPTPWAEALASPVGTSVAAAGAGIGLLLWEDGRRSAVLRAAASALVALSFALSGHAATAAERWITVPAIWLHALGASFWLGALWPLWLTVRRLPPAQAAPVLERFSRCAFLAVGVLLAAGALLALLQLSSPADLVTTGYGQRLSLKLVAVAGLLALAALNRFRLTPALRTGQATIAQRGLRRSLAADMVLAALVLSLTASLNLGAPPRSGAAASRAAARVAATTDGNRMMVEIFPAAPGINSLSLRLEDGQGRPLDAEEVEVRLALAEKGIEPMRMMASRAAAGHYAVAEIPLPVPGEWELRVDVLVDPFSKIAFRTRVGIGRTDG